MNENWNDLLKKLRKDIEVTYLNGIVRKDDADKVKISVLSENENQGIMTRYIVGELTVYLFQKHNDKFCLVIVYISEMPIKVFMIRTTDNIPFTWNDIRVMLNHHFEVYMRDLLNRIDKYITMEKN